jgi:membrane-bound lytic murein transglycosylase B
MNTTYFSAVFAFWPSLLLGLSLSTAHAMPFADCVAGLKTRAIASGVPDVIVRDSLDGVQPMADVVRLDQSQPEFSKGFQDYHQSRVTAGRAMQGQQLMQQHRLLLDSISTRYGVQGQYLLSFWGLETSYGSHFGRTPTLAALVTLACDGRRSAFFEQELMQALHMVNEGAILPNNLQGSWAGAFGHMQFMPSTFMRYAVDTDGDGRRNVWTSTPDALSSAANYLHQMGWQGNQRWGREVLLPDGFDYRLASIKNRLSLNDWASKGVKAVDGQPLPHEDMQAALLVPTGYEGPAFLVYDNFHLIMNWNRSESYALSVGLLADQIAGIAPPSKPFVPAPALSMRQVSQMQQTLKELGYDIGTVDGVFGSGTRSAIAQFQFDHKMIADGFPDLDLLAALGVATQP